MKSIIYSYILTAILAYTLIGCGTTDRVGSPRETPETKPTKVWVWWSVTAQASGGQGEGKTYVRIFFNDKPHLDGVFLELPQTGGEWINTGETATLKVVASSPNYTQGEIYAEFPEGRKQIGFRSENSGSFSLPARVE